ncbi:MAG: hypothetical protein KDK76_00535 [Chlamydiia bacterium]|nr:hypothetical protein [Chlamydiia bacterium]
MNLSRIKDAFLFHPFWHLFPLHFEPLSFGQCDQSEKKKSAQKFKKSNIPIASQNLGVSQNWRSRFNPIEAASYPKDRSDGERVKDRDANEGKNQVLNHDRYKPFNSG